MRETAYDLTVWRVLRCLSSYAPSPSPASAIRIGDGEASRRLPTATYHDRELQAAENFLLRCKESGTRTTVGRVYGCRFTVRR
jgi:hypothetical protein